jgi:hypothetical protein
MFSYAGSGAPYPVEYPDVLDAATGGTTVLHYADGRGAAAGIDGHSVVVGFPLESIVSESDRAAVTQALLRFAGH